MAEKQIYNLDELVAEEPQRVVVWKGQEHEVVGATGETYLKFLSYQGQLNKATGEKEQFEMAMKLLGLLTPTLPTEDVMKLDVTLIMKLVNFVTGSFAASATGEAAQAEGGAGETEPGE